MERKAERAWRAAQVGALCLCAVVTVAQRGGSQIESAYFDGRLVSFQVVQPQKGEREFRMGPWRFGARVPAGSKPRDTRLNLYLVSPGAQHRAEGLAEFDHNDVINAVPVKDGPVEWDVYWAVVLDPWVTADIRSERELLLLAQERFLPGDLFEFSDIPGAAMLRTFLKIDEVAGLRRYRSKDGRLPRLIIEPAGFAVRASVSEGTGEAASGEGHR